MEVDVFGLARFRQNLGPAKNETGTGNIDLEAPVAQPGSCSPESGYLT